MAIYRAEFDRTQPYYGRVLDTLDPFAAVSFFKRIWIAERAHAKQIYQRELQLAIHRAGSRRVDQSQRVTVNARVHGLTMDMSQGFSGALPLEVLRDAQRQTLAGMHRHMQLSFTTNR